MKHTNITHENLFLILTLCILIGTILLTLFENPIGLAILVFGFLTNILHIPLAARDYYVERKNKELKALLNQ